jgi:hypothetical protein
LNDFVGEALEGRWLAIVKTIVDVGYDDGYLLD